MDATTKKLAVALNQNGSAYAVCLTMAHAEKFATHLAKHGWTLKSATRKEMILERKGGAETLVVSEKRIVDSILAGAFSLKHEVVWFRGGTWVVLGNFEDTVAKKAA